MKRLGMLLVLFSVSMFALGCGETKPETPPAEEPTAGAPEEGGETAEPAVPEEDQK